MILSPKKQRVIQRYESCTNPTSPTHDVSMTDISTGFKSQLSSNVEMVEPLNLVAMSQLGEPDPTAISKHDLLSAMAFD